MNRLHTLLFVNAIIVLFTSFCFADAVGVITYAEGDVVVIRDEDELENIDIDTAVENYDLIKTGADGLVEIDIKTTLGQTMSIAVTSDTAFSIEIDRYESAEATAFELLTGGLCFKVGSLMDNEAVEVQTESANMGVRGTEFEVNTELTGDMLVTCEEGEVVCTDDEGEEQVAKPGYIVEKNPGKKFIRNNVKKEELASYRKEWRKKRREDFKKNALPSFKRYAMRFHRLYTMLNQCALELRKHKDILEKWAQYVKDRKKPPKKQLMEEIKIIEPVLLEMKKVMNVFERVVFQLKLMEPFHNQGVLKGEMKKGLEVEEFYKQMNKKLQEIQKMFRRFRRTVKLFIKMNNGHFPRKKAKIRFDHDFEQYNPQF
jgi:hypothetical protein